MAIPVSFTLLKHPNPKAVNASHTAVDDTSEKLFIDFNNTLNACFTGVNDTVKATKLSNL